MSAQPSQSNSKSRSPADELVPWFWIALWPALWMLGLVVAQIPSLIWPAFMASGRIEPKWYGLLCSSLLLITVQSGGLIALHISRRQVRAESKPKLGAIAASAVVLLLNSVVVLAALAARWASRA